MIEFPDEVVDLEAEIDTLRDHAERCRKIDIGGKAALGMGCAMLLMGFLWLNPMPLVIGIALILGSVALLGSNRTTLGDTITSITLLEERRVEMIKWSFRPSVKGLRRRAIRLACRDGSAQVVQRG